MSKFVHKGVRLTLVLECTVDVSIPFSPLQSAMRNRIGITCTVKSLK